MPSYLRGKQNEEVISKGAFKPIYPMSSKLRNQEILTGEWILSHWENLKKIPLQEDTYR